jgi:ABC-2 type transport system ATP-binding protein
MLPLSINQVNKSFKDHHVLQDISFNVQKGQIFGLVGLNGTGKTTLIKIIIDLLRRDSGDITVLGKDVRDHNNRYNMAYLPEKFIPSAYLKGKEFLQFSASYYKQKYDEEKTFKKSEELGLDPAVLSKMVSKYSKGMSQKLGLLSLFILDVPLIILDEPMSGLDPKARIQLKNVLKSYRDAGNTVFFSSHILADIDEICDNIAVLHDRKIQFTGTPLEFKAGYETLEQAFIQRTDNI